MLVAALVARPLPATRVALFMTKLATSSFVLCLFFFFGCGDTPAVNDADRASTFQSGYDEGYSMGITWPRAASVWWVGPHVTEDRHRDRPIPSLYRKAKDFSAGNKEENAELAEAFNWGVFCGFNDGVGNENAAVSITGVFDAEIYRECYDD